MAAIIKRIGEGVSKLFRHDVAMVKELARQSSEAEKVHAINRDLEQESRLNKIVVQVEALKSARQARLRGHR